MTNYIYSVYNTENGSFSPIFVAGNDYSAGQLAFYLRDEAGHSLLDSEVVYRIGIFNNESGLVESTDHIDVSESYLAFKERMKVFAREKEQVLKNTELELSELHKSIFEVTDK